MRDSDCSLALAGLPLRCTAPSHTASAFHCLAARFSMILIVKKMVLQPFMEVLWVAAGPHKTHIKICDVSFMLVLWKGFMRVLCTAQQTVLWRFYEGFMTAFVQFL